METKMLRLIGYAAPYDHIRNEDNRDRYEDVPMMKKFRERYGHVIRLDGKSIKTAIA